ncbi:MAG: dihydroxy-acid dehydratase [Rubrobacter sp.]
MKVAVVSPDAAGLAKSVAAPDLETTTFGVPFYSGGWGVALVREWVADRLEMDLLAEAPDALVFEAETPAELAGIIIAAVRLNLPAACVVPPKGVFTATIAALGFTPLDDGVGLSELVRGAVEEKGLRARRLVDSFSLANALRVALSLGSGSETFVHLAAIGREADVVGFPRMARVLTPETPAVTRPGSGWYAENGLPGILDHLGDALRDVKTISGTLKSYVVEASERPGEEYSHDFVTARTSGSEVLCRVPVGVEEISGRCRVFDSEAAAIEGLQKVLEAPENSDNSEESADAGDHEEDPVVFVVRGYGPSAVPGLAVLDELARSIESLGLSDRVSVLTDGLAPDGAPGSWASMFSPEAASGGVIGRLTNDDLLKIDLAEGRILTSVTTEDISLRRTFRKTPQKSLSVYAKRYAKNNLTAIEGATFG